MGGNLSENPKEQAGTSESGPSDPRTTSAFLGSGFGHTQMDIVSPFPDPKAHPRLIAFRRLTLALGTEIDLDHRLQRAIREIRHILGAERATIFLYNAAERFLYTRVHDGTKIHVLEVPVGQGIVGRAAELREAVNVEKVQDYPDHDPAFDRLAGFHSEAVLAAPMTTEEGELLGVVQVLNKPNGSFFTNDDEKLLVTLTQVLSVNIGHAKLYDKTRSQLHELQLMRVMLEGKVAELELLYTAIREVSAALTPEDLVHRIGRLILKQLPYQAVTMVFVPTSGNSGRAIWLEKGAKEAATIEVGACPWLTAGDDMLVAPMTQLGSQLVTSAPAPTTVAGFPENDAVSGAIGLYDGATPHQLPQDHHKILAVMLATLVYGFQRVYELESERREDRLITIGRTVSGILHDLRTPISVIGGFAQIMAKTDEPEQRVDLSDGIRDQLGRIKKMTEDVLAFARGDITVLPEKVYLSAFVKNLEQSCATAYAQDGVAFVFECSDRGMARFDEHKLNRVLLNLCRNAAQAMSSGGTCRVKIDRVKDELHIQVSDQGVGIPENIKARVFQAFESHGKEGGTGLGLSMARRIVEAHGGKIRIDSTEGRGTDVHITIPAEFSTEERSVETHTGEEAPQ